MTPGQRFDLVKQMEVVDFGHVPTKDLERAWLTATCLYELFDTSALSDARWDQLTAHLWKFRARLSPYFTWAVPLDCLKSSTGSGIDWDRDLPALVKAGCKEIVDAGLC